MFLPWKKGWASGSIRLVLGAVGIKYPHTPTMTLDWNTMISLGHLQIDDFLLPASREKTFQNHGANIGFFLGSSLWWGHDPSRQRPKTQGTTTNNQSNYSWHIPTTYSIKSSEIFWKKTRHHGDTGDESDLISKKNTTEQLSLSQCQNQSQRRLTSNKKILPFRSLLEQLYLLHQRHNDAIHGCQWWTWCIFITITIHRFGDQGIVFIEKHCIGEIRKPWKT